jgi:hypothetical protein
MTWLIAHYQDLLAIVGAIVTVASLIVKLTPSQNDDAVVAKIVGLLNYFSVVNPKK